MRVQNIDHVVITTNDLAACLHFYADILGLEHIERNGRHELWLAGQKFNIHQRPAEFLPAAARPTPGSMDICLVVVGPLAAVQAELAAKGVLPEAGPLARQGALGPMTSLYLRDPDGNLVELASYE